MTGGQEAGVRAIIWLGEEMAVDQVGGKGRALSRLVAAGLPVPAGFVVAVDGLADLDRIESQLSAALSRLAVPAVAVRSSAVGEDGAATSFAGVHVSRLNVAPSAIRQALVEVGASASSPVALEYRARRGLSGTARMAAVVQAMVVPDVSGVAFTREPRSGAGRIVVEASWGLGEAIVSGLVTPDHWELDASGRLLSEAVADKDVAIVAVPGGTAEIAVAPERRSRACLDPAALARVVDAARACERLFECPQDVEWALSEGRLWLLQSRPITTALT